MGSNKLTTRAIQKVKTGIKHYMPGTYLSIKYAYKKVNTTNQYKSLIYQRFERTLVSEEEKANFKQMLSKKVKIYQKGTKAEQLYALLKSVNISSENSRFFYSLDVFQSWHLQDRLMVNSTLDYERVIKAPLDALRIKDSGDTPSFVYEVNKTVDAIEYYLERCIAYAEKSDLDNKDHILEWLQNMKIAPAQTFEEALQRVLFINQILWQTEHRLVGLGRLDYILDEIYQHDPVSKNETAVLKIISDFLLALHQYYWYKSDALLGDTGQIIILGGKQIDGSFFSNRLTYLFIQAIKTLQKPDPKILLRWSSNIPLDLMDEAIKCIKTGIGCPLFSNDDKVIPELVDFGYETEDAYNYVTSACWEPLIPGIAHEQNNIELINFLLPFQLISEKEGYSTINNEEELFEAYSRHLKGHVWYICEQMNRIKWEADPLVSTFTQPCRDAYKDISEGGGKYNNYGVLSLALSNAVNAFMCIKDLVFDNKLITLERLDYICQHNYSANDRICELLKATDKIFGKDIEIAERLSNQITYIASEQIRTYQNIFGGKAKFGLSSPSYITVSKNFPASFDGRKYGDPFAVHISADGNSSYTELMQFAAKLDYTEARFNGNVVDFFVAPNFIENNFIKFTKFIYDSLNIGVYQLQINVVSSSTLIAARKNPKDYPNLIVRVWGFNAYYIELPDDYKDYLIERALQSERIN